MVTAERRPGYDGVITRQQPRPDLTGLFKRPAREKPVAAVTNPEPGSTSTLDFLNYHHPELEAEAEARGFEHGRIFLDTKKSPTHAFLNAARYDGAIDRIFRKATPEYAERILKMVWFFVCTDATSLEISEMFGFNARGTAGARFRQFTKDLYREAGSAVKDAYPVEKLSVARILTQRRRDKFSAAQEGKRSEVRKLAAQGKSSIQIASALDISTNTAIHVVSGLRKQRVLYKSQKTRTTEVVAAIPEPKNRSDIFRLLNVPSVAFLENSPDYMTIKQLLRSLNLLTGTPQVKLLRMALDEADEYYRTAYYSAKDANGEKRVRQEGHFVHVFQAPRIQSIIEKDSMLKEALSGERPLSQTSIRQVSGPKQERVPTHPELKSSQWIAIGREVARRRINWQDIHTSFPIYRVGRFTHKIPANKLVEFLEILDCIEIQTVVDNSEAAM